MLWTLILAVVGCAGDAGLETAPHARTLSPAPPALDHPNFVFIDIDSWRASRLEAERDGAAVMPNLRALQDRGTTFTHAFAQSGWTVPGLTALLTGHLPVAVNVGAASTALLPLGARTLPEVLRLYGYHTAVLWGTGVEVGFHELSRGFDVQLSRGGGLGTAAAAGGSYGRWVEGPPAEPFFLMVHEFDAHVPGAELSAATQHLFGAERGCPGGSHRDVFGALAPVLGEAAAMRHVVAHYDGALRGYDAEIGRLLVRLEASGTLSRTIVVVTSNHGEDFGEHGPGIKHGELYDTTLGVPLVFAGPGVLQGALVETMVQGIDLAPTLVALAHAPADQTVDGRSLVGLLGGAPASPELSERAVFSLTDDTHLSVRTSTRKLMLGEPPPPPPPPPVPGQGRPPPVAGGAPASHTVRAELYDLGADPAERHDLFTEGAAPDLMAALLAFQEERRAAALAATHTRVDDALRREVQAHGYWEVAGGGAEAPK